MKVGDLVNYTNRNGKILVGIVTCVVHNHNAVQVLLTDEIRMGRMWVDAEWLEVLSESR